MKGTITLTIGNARHTRRFTTARHRRHILFGWAELFDLRAIAHTIEILPDDEEVMFWMTKQLQAGKTQRNIKPSTEHHWRE